MTDQFEPTASPADATQTAAVADSATTTAPPAAESQAAPASPPATAAPADNGQDDVDRQESDWFAKRDGRATTPAADGDEVDEPEQPAGDNAATAPVFTADELTVIKRLQLDPEDVSAMKPDRRARYLANEAKRIAFTDQLVTERNQRQQQPPPAQGQPPAQQGNNQQPPAGQQATAPAPADDEDMKALRADYGDDFTKRLDGVINRRVAALVQSQAQPADTAAIVQANQALLARIVHDDIDRGFSEAPTVTGVDFADPATRQRVIQEAQAMLQATGFDPVANNFRHAIPKAAASLYHKEILTENGRARQQQQAKTLRGSPTRTGAIPKSRAETPASEDEAESEWFAKHKTA